MAAAATGGMIRMSDIASALELCKSGSNSTSRSGSVSSLCSWTTTTPTPPNESPSRPSLTSGSSLDSTECASPCNTSSHSCGRGVRFADECGGDLITDVRTATDWWEEMVFGVDKCDGCGQAEDDGGKMGNETTVGQRKGHGAAAAPPPPGGEGGLSNTSCNNCGTLRRKKKPCTELFQFVEELSRGIEATLILPSLIGKKKRSVLLYTEDNGESLCWMETGNSRPREPYNLPCANLLEVKDQSGPALAAARAAGYKHIRPNNARYSMPLGIERRGSGLLGARGGGGDITLAAAGEARTGAPATTGVVSAGPSGAACSRSLSSEEPWVGEGFSGVGSSSNSSSVAVQLTGENGGNLVRVKLRWRVQTTSTSFSVRKVTMVDVRCANPDVFVKGMVQLREFNTEIA